jgi:hypothetical protein
VRTAKARLEKIRRKKWEARRERDQAYRKAHDGRSYDRDRHRDVKLEAFRHYGGVKIPSCICCGYSDLRALVLHDSKFRGEVEHGHELYEKLKARGYPDGYQVMCSKCANRLAGRGHPTPLKIKVIGHYNRRKRCVRCKEDDMWALTIDHIHGGGRAHMKSLGIIGGPKFYRWLVDHDYPSGYQVLCWNCQQIKQEKEHEWKSKPHFAHEFSKAELKDATIFRRRAEDTAKLTTQDYRP